MTHEKLIGRLRKLSAYGCCLEAADALEQMDEKLASAECIISQAARDTFGKDMTPKEFADA